MKKAYLVYFAPIVRVIADEKATEDKIIDLAVEKVKSEGCERYVNADFCEWIKEDVVCSFNPQFDKV